MIVEKKMFVIDFSFPCLGNGQLLYQTDSGKLSRIGNAWTYVLGTEKRDLKALQAMPEEFKKRDLFWSTSSIVVEARNVCECLELFLAFIRQGHRNLSDDFARGRKVFIDGKIKNEEPVLEDIGFNNWPIKIKNIMVFPPCERMMKEWKDWGLLTCSASNDEIVEGDLCPLVYYGSALDDGECPVSAEAYGIGRDIKKSTEEIRIHGLEFTLIKVSWL